MRSFAGTTTEPTPAVSEIATDAAPAADHRFPRRTASDPRRWVVIGGGVGVDIRDGELETVVVRVRPSGASLIGALSVPDFRSQPAAEWGRVVSEFLRRNAAGHIAATVLLPRHEVIVRQIALPGVSDSDLESAVRLQMDSLHPFAEDDVYFSWSRIGKTGSVLVGIVRRDVLDGYSALMAEAGVKVAAFTFSAAALYSALRLLHVPPSEFLVVQPTDGGVEVFGESSSRALYSATLPLNPGRAAGVARSELRLEPGTEARPLAAVLPQPVSMPRGLDPAADVFEKFLMPYAAALAGACPWLAVNGNLLPADRRRASSRIRLIPTITLATVLVCFLVLLALQSTWSDSRYLGVLQHEIQKYEPAAKRVEALDRAILATRSRSQSLDDFRRRARLDMDALAEVTRLVPAPGWVSAMEMDRNTVQIAGETEQAAPLLEAFDKSPLFSRSEFTMPMSRSGAAEMFRIRTQRETPGGAK